jgi:hypothetical protein
MNTGRPKEGPATRTTASAAPDHDLTCSARQRAPFFFSGAIHGRQSEFNTAVLLQHAADACLPYELGGVLPLLLRLVRLRAAHAGHQGRVSPVDGADCRHQYRGRRHHHPRAPAGGAAVRPLRPAQDLHRPAGHRRHPGAGRGHGAELRELPAVPPGDRRRRRQLRDHPVPHLGDVRPARGGHRQRGVGRLGQQRRRPPCPC